MDWNRAIEINRVALVQYISAVVAAFGLAQARGAVTLNSEARRAILMVLRPAESALRRLIIIAARRLNLKFKQRTTQPDKNALPDFTPFNQSRATGIALFKLYDPRKRFTADADLPTTQRGAFMPRISVPGTIDPVFDQATTQLEEAPIDAAKIIARIDALTKALDTIPKQAQRLMRIQAKRALAPAGPLRAPPMRCGFPPFYRRRHRHPIDDVLNECHALALWALEPPS